MDSTRTSTPMARSPSAWVLTKIPYAGRAASGHMLVTKRTRIFRTNARRRGRLARGGRERIAMLVENNPYPQDVRVRREAEALATAGHEVRVIAPRSASQPR